MPREKLIQLRKDIAANWTSTNPILALGEKGLETDTLKEKVGDGSTVWTSLAYWNEGGATVEALEFNNNTNAIFLNNVVGNNYNVTAPTANTNTTFNLGSMVINGFAIIKINIATTPTFPAGVTQEGGIAFEANTDIYLTIWSKGTSHQETVYRFESLLVDSGTISGSITDNQVAIGAATADSIEGDSNLTYDSTTNDLTVGEEGGALEGSLVLKGRGTGSTLGGKITLNTADDHDASAQSYTIKANTDNLNIYKNAGTNIMTYENSSAKWILNQYGSGTKTGTATYALNVDATGNIIEGAVGGGGTVESLTTTGTSGASTLIGGVLNIPNYATGGGSLPFLNIEDAPYNCVADALGDAGVDSTVGFELALSDLVAAGGGTLIIPDTPGLRFNIGVLTATTRDLSNVTITSYGTGSIFCKATVGGGQGRGVLINLADGTDNFVIEKLDVLASSGCFRANFETGIICSQAGNLSNITIRNNKLGNESKALTAVGVDGITFYRATNTADVDLITNLLIENNEIDLYGISVYGIQLLREVHYPKIRDNTVHLRSWTETLGQVYNAIAVYGDSKYFEVTGNTVLGSGHSAIAISQASNGCVKNNFVFNCINSVEAGIEVEYKAGHGTDTFQSNSVVIRDNYVENCEYGIWVTERDETAITLAPYNILIDGNTVIDSLSIDIFVASEIASGGERTSVIRDIVISQNWCENVNTSGGKGIAIYDGEDIDVINNTCIGQSYGLIHGRSSTIYTTGVIRYIDNKMYNNTVNGFLAESGQSHCVLKNNLVKNSTISAIKYGSPVAQAKITLIGNIVYGGTTGFDFAGWTGNSGTMLINNEAYDCSGKGYSITVNDGIATGNVSGNCTTAPTIGSAGSTVVGTNVTY